MEEARSFVPLLIVVILACVVPLLLSSVRGRLAIPIIRRNNRGHDRRPKRIRLGLT
jgi:hypothetical protein